MRKQNEAGFTLIELVVALLCCSVITLAVMTLLLTGIRISRAAEKNTEMQQTVRIVLAALEDMASDGSVHSVAVSDDGWSLLDADGTALLRYSDAQDALLTGDGTALLSGLTDASAALSEGGRLLTVSVTVGGESYELAVYCRTG